MDVLHPKVSLCGNPIPKLIHESRSKTNGGMVQAFKVTLPNYDSDSSSECSDQELNDPEFPFHQYSYYDTLNYDCQLRSITSVFEAPSTQDMLIVKTGLRQFAERLYQRIDDRFYDSEDLYILHARDQHDSTLTILHINELPHSLTGEALYESMLENNGCENYVFVFNRSSFTRLLNRAVGLGMVTPRESYGGREVFAEESLHACKKYGIQRKLPKVETIFINDFHYGECVSGCGHAEIKQLDCNL